jgi:aminoglycoside 6'-N-acetyltransferase
VDQGLRPPEFVFRPLDRSDLPLLAEWLGRPHVARWWREPSDLAAVEATYGPLIDGSDPTEGFIATYQGQGQGKRRGQPLAFLQRYRLDDDPEWQRVIAVALAESGGGGGGGGGGGDSANDDPIRGGVGIDYLIGEQTMTGRGLGRRMIDAFVDLTWDRYPDITAVVVAVDQRNEASWRALEGAAFLRTWAGMLDSDDPSDQGPHYIYVRRRSSG